jgi:glycosyltransferase involved in cell wall biosynthesis
VAAFGRSRPASALSDVTIMSPDISIAVPAHNEEAYIGRCIRSVQHSASVASASVEIVVALNRCTDGTRRIAESLGARCVVQDAKCISKIRNTAVRATTSNHIATLDADSWMAPETVSELLRHLRSSSYIGGGSTIRLERISVGIVFSLATVALHVLARGVSAGMLWFNRETFEAVGGFDETLYSAEDLDFAVRLKRLGRQRGLRYGTIRRYGISTSCRKFDKFGDWYLFRNPRLVRELTAGRNRSAADGFFYDVER